MYRLHNSMESLFPNRTFSLNNEVLRTSSLKHINSFGHFYHFRMISNSSFLYFLHKSNENNYFTTSAPWHVIIAMKSPILFMYQKPLEPFPVIYDICDISRKTLSHRPYKKLHRLRIRYFYLVFVVQLSHYEIKNSYMIGNYGCNITIYCKSNII